MGGFIHLIFWGVKNIWLVVFVLMSFRVSLAQSNDVGTIVKEYLNQGDTVLAIEQHKKFSSLQNIAILKNESLTGAIAVLAELKFYLGIKEFSKCDSIFQTYNSTPAFNNVTYCGYFYKYLSNFNYYTSNNEKALEYNLKAMKYFEHQKDTINIISLLKNNGLLYVQISNFDKAEELFNSAYELARLSHNDEKEKSSLKNIAAVYLSKEEFEKSLEKYLYIMANYKLSDKDKAMVYNNMSTIYSSKKDYDNALFYADSSLFYKEKIGDKKKIADTKINLAYIAIHKKDYAKAEKLLRESLKCYTDLKDDNKKISIYYNFAHLYGKLNKTDSVLKYIDLYADTNDTVISRMNQQAMLDLSAKYESEKKDQQIIYLNQRDELKEVRLQKQKLLNFVFVLLTVVITCVAFIINRHRFKLKKAKQALVLSNQAKDRILSVIGHDLRGPVGGLNTLIELYMQMPDLNSDDIDQLLETALESSTSTYLLLENLLTWANSQRGEISYNPQCLPVYPLIKQIVEVLDQSMNNRGVNISIDVNTKLTAYVDIDMFKIVLRNLISNSIKFSPNNSTIRISAIGERDGVLFFVEDEGGGMCKRQIESLFAKKESYYLENKNSGKGTGLGLILCKEFVERHGGSIWVDSEKGKGACFSFLLPHLDGEVMEIAINEMSKV